MEIVEFSSHLTENIRNQIFKNRAFIAVKISLQDVVLCAILQHTDKKAAVPHIHLEYIFLSVPIQRQFRNAQIIAADNDTGILNPLKAPGIF